VESLESLILGFIAITIFIFAVKIWCCPTDVWERNRMMPKENGGSVDSRLYVNKGIVIDVDTNS
jgi:hypothetical protein